LQVAAADYKAKILHLQQELVVLSKQLSGGQEGLVHEVVQLKRSNSDLQSQVGWGGICVCVCVCVGAACRGWGGRGCRRMERGWAVGLVSDARRAACSSLTGRSLLVQVTGLLEVIEHLQKGSDEGPSDPDGAGPGTGEMSRAASFATDGSAMAAAAEAEEALAAVEAAAAVAAMAATADSTPKEQLLQLRQESAQLRARVRQAERLRPG
jgi:hypothetical protein